CASRVGNRLAGRPASRWAAIRSWGRPGHRPWPCPPSCRRPAGEGTSSGRWPSDRRRLAGRERTVRLKLPGTGVGSTRAAELRLLDYYLHTGHAAAMLLTPSSDCGDLAPPAPGAIVAPPATVDEAMAWFAAESRPLIAACARAVEGDLGAHSWQLPWVAAPYLIRQGRWGDFAATQQAAVSADERVGDLRGVGHTCYHLGYALALADDSPAAEQQLRKALVSFTAADDPLGQGLALHGLAVLLQEQ